MGEVVDVEVLSIVVAAVDVDGVVVVAVGPGAIGAAPEIELAAADVVLGSFGSLPPSVMRPACASSMRMLGPVISRITAW